MEIKQMLENAHSSHNNAPFVPIQSAFFYLMLALVTILYDWYMLWAHTTREKGS